MASMTTRIENDTTIIFEREFDAPVASLFKMYSTPDIIKQWWAPNGFDIPVCEIDFRENGSWFYVMHCTDKNLGEFYDTKNYAKAIYDQIIENKRIAYTHYFADENGDVNQTIPGQKISIDFVDLDGRTKIINKAEFANKDALDQIAPMMEAGVAQSFDRLSALL